MLLRLNEHNLHNKSGTGLIPTSNYQTGVGDGPHELYYSTDGLDGHPAENEYQAMAHTGTKVSTTLGDSREHESKLIRLSQRK